jgi:peroxiredoxin Q/BCP
MGAIVLGISVDGIETQKKFKDKLALPFDLLSDNNMEIAKTCGVLNARGTRAQRKTFIIDPEGRIAHIFKKVNVRKHDKEVKEILSKL